MVETAVFLQDACLQHKYIRSKDKSNIVECPERLRAVNIGIAGAIARLEGRRPVETAEKVSGDVGELANVMGKLHIESSGVDTNVLEIVRSQASVDILNNPAVKFIHGDIEGDVYLENLKKWAKESWNKIAQDGLEIPEGLSKGDLYLCPESIDAIQGALGTVCEAVDRVVDGQGSMKRTFVAVRPPGHHCGEDTPSGFCFVNNVAVAAAHAHLKHNIARIVILDIDLHHGNGTQSIIWSINEETYRQILENEAETPDPPKVGPRIYYGSIHDILSYPCEDGNPALVQAASVSLHKSHGQYIENIHLQTYKSEAHFWDVLYKNDYSRLLRRAEEFLDGTGGPGDDVLVFISCGMDACEHEYASMSRHNRKVPTSFYHRFTKDARAFADKYASGRLISVLEGGYSDRALISASMAHICGLASSGGVDEEWWNVENLAQLEDITKKRRGGRPSLNKDNSPNPEWLERALAIFNSLDQSTKRSTGHSVPTLPSTRTLRDRTKFNQANVERIAPETDKKQIRPSVGEVGTMTRKPQPSPEGESGERVEAVVKPESEIQDSPLLAGQGKHEPVASQQEKRALPRVILKLGKRPDGEV